MAALGITESVAIVGPVLAAASAATAGISQPKQADCSAQIAAQNANLVRKSAEQNAAVQASQARKQLGAAAAFGAAGVSRDGSVLDILSSSVMAAKLDEQTIRFKGRVSALGTVTRLN